MTNPPVDEGRHDRYPGPRSFADDDVDRRLYFGREQETETVLHRVRSVRMLVLFGKSGLGKTSLLQAGLFPRLRDHDLLPVPVRFNHPGADPVATMIAAIEEECRQRGVDITPGDTGSMWTYLKTTDLWLRDRLLIPVLVLDQFEEIFTLQDAGFRRALASELRDLSGRTLPRSVREARQRGEALRYDGSPPELRVIFSFREEYLAFLEELVADVPAILEHRFRLLPLEGQSARRAIEAPAQVDDASMFGSRPFRYDAATLGDMLAFLSNADGEVEPFQLQVLCRHVEQTVVTRQAQEPSVTVDQALLGGGAAMARVLSQFYEEGIARIPARRQRRRAQQLCEVGLLSPDGKRVSVEEGSLRREFKLTPSSLDVLIDNRLLRKDTRPGLDGFYYELSHDSLTQPVRAAQQRHRRRRAWRIGITFTLIAGIAVIGWFSERGQRVDIQQAVTAFADPLRGLDGVRGPEMVKLEPGSFRMGDLDRPSDDGRRVPAGHAVTFARPFSIGRFEVTFEEFRHFCTTHDELLAALAETMRQLEDTLRTRFERDMRPVIEQQVRSDLKKQFQLMTDREIERRLAAEMKKSVLGNTRLPTKSIEEAVRKKLEPKIRREVEADLRRSFETQIRKETDVRLAGMIEQDFRARMEQTLQRVEELVARILPSLAQLPDAAVKQALADVDDPDTQLIIELLRQRIVDKAGVYWPCPSGHEQASGRLPVVDVSWQGAVAYAKWLSKHTGRTYRLPTEAEWEYAARAGTETVFWWGDDHGEARANCDGCGSQWDNKNPAPVGSFGANRWGLHDTAGNLWEWVRDCWHDDRPPPDDGSALYSEGCAEHVVRGGAWNAEPHEVRSASRAPRPEQHAGVEVGFRLVREE